MKKGNRQASDLEVMQAVEAINLNPGWQIRFDFEEQKTEEGRFFHYSYVNVKEKTKKEIIVAIIRSEYDIDDEFAAINEGGERHATFLELRNKAERIANMLV